MYSIKNNGEIYFAGREGNGEQVLMGFQQPQLIALFFGEAGDLRRVEKRASNATPRVEPMDAESDAFQSMIHWQKEIAFEPGTIKVESFRLPDLFIGVAEMPAQFVEFIQRPDAFDQEQRKSLQNEVRKWKRRGDFVLNWNEEYWLNRSGALITS